MKPTVEEQLQRWVEGESICPNENGECCPDFSCCNPKLLQPREVREAFAVANDDQRFNFLMNFLGAMTAESGVDVHIAGKDPQ